MPVTTKVCDITYLAFLLHAERPLSQSLERIRATLLLPTESGEGGRVVNGWDEERYHTSLTCNSSKFIKMYLFLKKLAQLLISWGIKFFSLAQLKLGTGEGTLFTRTMETDSSSVFVRKVVDG